MQLKEIGSRNYWRYYNLFDEDKVVGCVYIEHTNKLFLSNFLIDSKYRDKGYGSSMMNLILELAGDKPVVLEVEKDNEEAIQFYKKFGFFQIDETETRYRYSNKQLS
jgi:ribosomal protein S18 acetylase RimI-like enzyme